MPPPGIDIAPDAVGLPKLGRNDVPDYLSRHYWWAYVHPRAVHLFERQWLVNLILWGNYRRLRDAALQSLGDALPGKTLQIACVYGDLTERLCQRVKAGDGHLDVVDVLPIQLANLRHKLSPEAPVQLLERNSAELGGADARYDRAVLFFLLHEQPAEIRRRTLEEAFRVVKPGGTILIIDYAKPSRWNPLRYLWLPILTRLEPFAPDLWHQAITSFLPDSWRRYDLSHTSFFGGLYQRLVISR